MIWNLISKVSPSTYLIASAVSFVFSLICLGAVRLNSDFTTLAALFGGSIIWLWGFAIVSSERRKYKRDHATPTAIRHVRILTKEEQKELASSQSRFR